jgi:phospholipase/carboxylesterase
VRDPSETELIEFQGWTLRLRTTETRPPRLLLLIHGWTGDENSMWVFARHLPADFWILAPRAPHPTKPSGFSWRVGSPARGSLPEFDDLRQSSTDLISMLDELAADRDLPSGAWSVMGFSQGAAVAATLALLFPQRVDRLALLAGFVPPGADILAAALPLRGKRVFVAHGSRDELVDIEYGRQAVQVLESAGAIAQICEDPVGHKVSANCMRQLERYFA